MLLKTWWNPICSPSECTLLDWRQWLAVGTVKSFVTVVQYNHLWVQDKLDPTLRDGSKGPNTPYPVGSLTSGVSSSTLKKAHVLTLQPIHVGTWHGNGLAASHCHCLQSIRYACAGWSVLLQKVPNTGVMPLVIGVLPQGLYQGHSIFVPTMHTQKIGHCTDSMSDKL